MPGVGQLPGQHQVTVDDRADRVPDRVVWVIAFNQHGVEPGDRTGVGGADPFQQPGQHGERRRREPTAAGDLACGQADLPLGDGEPGHAVHQQVDVQPGVTEGLADPGGGVGRVAAHQRRLIRRGHDDNAAGQAFGPKIVLQKLPNLTAPLANQTQHVDIGAGTANQHGKQAGLPNTGAGHDGDPLPSPAGQERVDDPNPDRHRLGNRWAGQRGWRGVVDRNRIGPRQRTFAVQRTTETIQHSPEQLSAGRHLHLSAQILHRVTDPMTAEVAVGQHRGTGTSDGDDLGRHGLFLADLNQVTETDPQADHIGLALSDPLHPSEHLGTGGRA